MGSSISIKNPEDITVADKYQVLNVAAGEIPNLEAVAKLIRQGKFKNIVCLCGAGISTSKGIGT